MNFLEVPLYISFGLYHDLLPSCSSLYNTGSGKKNKHEGFQLVIF